MLQVPTAAANMQHILCSLIGTCRLNNAESEKLLHYVTDHMQDWSANRVPHISRKRTTPGCTRCHTRPGTLVNQNGFILQVPVICYVLMRGRTRFCGLSAWACQKRSVVWLSHLPDVMASVSFIWMPTLNACRVYPLSTGNQKQHEIINHGNSAGYSDCVAAGQYRLRIGNYL